MPYIGQPLNAGNLSVDVFTGNGSTTVFALTYSVGSSESVAIYLDGVKQAVSTYVAIGTVLTFTTAPPNLVGIEVVFLALSISLPTPGDGTVTAAKIAANAVDETKLKDALVADFTEVVVSASDSILLGDATDSGNTKRDTVQGILDLVPVSGLSTFTSADQTITAGGALTIAHGLGAIPSYVKAFHRATGSDIGFTIGQIVTTQMQMSSMTAEGKGCSIRVDATNLYIRFGSAGNPFNHTNGGTGVSNDMTNSKWKIFFQVYA